MSVPEHLIRIGLINPLLVNPEHKDALNILPTSRVTKETKEKKRATYFKEVELEVLMLAHEEFKLIIVKKKQ